VENQEALKTCALVSLQKKKLILALRHYLVKAAMDFYEI
jgi:hypothetical protein